MRAFGSTLRLALRCIAVPLLLAACGERNTYQPPPPAEVSVAKPEQRKVTLYMEVTGTTAPYNHVDLVARVQGFLDKVGYKDGAAVKKGDLLFQIDKQFKPLRMNRELFDRSWTPIKHKLLSVARSTGAHVIDPMDWLCNNTVCLGETSEGTPFYKDSGHLRAIYVRDHATFMDQTLGIETGSVGK